MAERLTSFNCMTPLPLTDDDALALLSRHQQRRHQRVPTLSVISGCDGQAERLVCRWAQSEQRSAYRLVASEPAGALWLWFVALVESLSVVTAAWNWLAQRADDDSRTLPGRLTARSREERAMFLDRVLGGRNATPADKMCRAIIESACQVGQTTEPLEHRLHQACGGDALLAVSGVVALSGDERLPILQTPAAMLSSAELHTLFTQALSLMSAAPALPIIVLVGAEPIAEYLTATPECRALALVREGLIRLRQPAAPIAVKRPLNDDDARSAAERYLFERLQAHPETRGLFELNGMLDLGGGRRALEVDLLARGARVAVEIDGYYHFTDWDAYRRDRDKDVSLQLAGYLVVRCLADDVAGRLEAILETILVALRRPPPDTRR